MDEAATVAPLDGVEEHFWRSLGRVVHLMPRLLDDEMLRSAGLTMSEFAVLSQLREAPAGERRMTELAVAIGLSASRVTRVVAGLAARGLVSRRRHAGDGRGAVATLTDEGRRRADAAAAHHTRVARRRVLAHVPPDQVEALAAVLDRISAATVPGADRTGAGPAD